MPFGSRTFIVAPASWNDDALDVALGGAVNAVVRGDVSALVLDLGAMRPASVTIRRLTDWLDRNADLFASKLRGIAVAAPHWRARLDATLNMKFFLAYRVEIAVVSSRAAAEIWAEDA